MAERADVARLAQVARMGGRVAVEFPDQPGNIAVDVVHDRIFEAKALAAAEAQHGVVSFRTPALGALADTGGGCATPETQAPHTSDQRQEDSFEGKVEDAKSN